MAAIDHGLVMGPPAGAMDAEVAVARVLACEPDGVFISAGLLERFGTSFGYRNAPLAIVRGDLWLLDSLPLAPGTIPQHVENHLRNLGEQYRVICEPEHALALGADAIAMFLLLGASEGRVVADNVAALAERIARATASACPWSSRPSCGDRSSRTARTPDLLACAARMAVELGADPIKTEYTGDTDTMRHVVDSSSVPVLVLGGPTKRDDPNLLPGTKDALNAGARGVIYGRSVWQAEDPMAVAKALRQMIHDER